MKAPESSSTNYKTQRGKDNFKEKLEAMEKGIHAITRMVVCHETEIKDVKKKTYIINATQDTKYEWSK